MIPWIKPKIWGNEKEHLNKAFDSTWLSAGSYVDLLEERFRDIHGVKHAISTCNGTASIHLVLDSLGVSQGDKVVVPGFAFGAAANIASVVGATPVFCDVNPDTYLLDTEHFEQLLEQHPDIKAIIPVHTYGPVCDMKKICEIAAVKNVAVVEDVAEAMFSKVDGKYAGTFGVANSFSFQTTKTITTAEGGCILTDNEVLADKMRTIRSHGMKSKKYWHIERGNNFRLSNLLASLGAAQLEHWKTNIEKRQVLYTKFLEKFAHIEGIKVQKIEKNVDPVMWTFSIYIEENFSKLSRDEIIESLHKSGIETRPGFYTFRQMEMYEAPFLKHSEDVSSRIICLPFYIDLTEEEILKIYQELLKLKR